MIFSRPLWILALLAPTSAAFLQSHVARHSSSFRDAAVLNQQSNDDDLTSVLTQVSSALATADDSSSSNDYDIQYEQYLKAMHSQLEKQQQQNTDSTLTLRKNDDDDDDMSPEEQLATAALLAGAADLGAVAFENVRKSAHGTLSVAIEALEKEEDLSKLPQKLVQQLQRDIETRLDQMEQLKSDPTLLLRHAKDALESDEMKTAPDRAFHAIQEFFNSKEVKQAQQAVKDGLESDEFKAFQERAKDDLRKAQLLAAQAVKEGLESKESKALQDRAKLQVDAVLNKWMPKP